MAGTPFVARDEELARLRAVLARASAGDPGAVLLAGDAGVGKTRLLERFAQDATDAGATVIVGHCVDLGGVGLPYLPFSEALGQLRGQSGHLDEVIEQRPAIGRLLDTGGTESADGSEQQAARLQLFDGIAAALTTSGRRGHPLVVVIEDLHWADPSSRDVLRFLLARMRADHVLIVASYRTDDLHRRHPMRPVLAELLRHPRVEQVELHPFTETELADFAVAVTGTSVPDATLHRVLDRSEGNAYFAEELLESGPDTASLPVSLADVLRTRLEQNDPAVQQLARIASVAGRRVGDGLLRAVAAHDPSLAAPGAVDSAVREAVAHQLLIGEGEDYLAFRHALLAEVVSADLLPSERAGLHRAYLKALSADPGLGSHAERAHHALNSHDVRAALTESHAAADEAADVLAPAEELRHLESVLELWDAVPDATESITDSRIDVEMRAASAASRAGQPSRAAGLARSALDAAEPEDVIRFTSAAAFFLIDDNHAEEALERCTAALALLEDRGPSVQRARVLAAHARSAVNSDQDDLARASADRAVEESRELDVPDAEADALATLAIVEVNDADTAAGLLRQAMARAKDAGDLLTEVRIAHNLTSTLYYAGRLDESAEVCRNGIERARSTGVLWMGYGVSLLVFWELIRYVTGDLTQAPPFRDWAPDSALATLSVIDLYAAVARGDADAIDRGQAVKADWHADPMMAMISGGNTIDALTWAGRQQEALDLTLSLIDFMNRSWNDYFLGGIWLSALGLAALADRAAQTRLTGGDPAADVRMGETLIDRAVRTAERGRPRGGRLGPEGRAWLARAHADFARLRGEDDPDLWQACVDEFDYGYRYEVARSRYRQAAAFMARDRRAEAERAAAASVAEATAIGARPLIDAVTALARRARLDVPGLRTTSSVLTGREEQVLALVSQGLTNRQVGERLFISGKTVSVHMSNVLDKLGASGRAEAVAVAHRRGLLHPDRVAQ